MKRRQVIVLLLLLLLIPSVAAADEGDNPEENEDGCRLYSVSQAGIEFDPYGCVRRVIDKILPPLLGGPL